MGFTVRGANVNAVNSCGATPLHEAINRGVKDVCSELLNNGADVYVKAHKGFVLIFFFVYIMCLFL